MTMQYDVNFIPATFAEAIFRLKQLLKTAGWIHQASSDGTTFTTTPGNVNDAITSAGIGAGGMENSLAWFVLQQPGGTRQFCFQIDTTTTWYIKLSVSAGFTGGTPSATEVPSATDEIVLVGLGPDAGPTFEAIPLYPDGQQTFNIVADDAAPHGWWAGGHGYNLQDWLVGPNPGPMWYDHTPANRAGHAMTFDVNNEVVVLFGGTPAGVGGYEGADETWTWDGDAWRAVTTTKFPSKRGGLSMAYDETLQRTILFGGFIDDPAETSDETWSFDGSKWTQLFPATIPSQRANHGMVYSPTLGAVVMFGGRTTGSTASTLNDTWTWDGTDWVLLHDGVSGAPGPRDSFGISIDPVNGQVLIFGGQDAGAPNNQTWQFDTVGNTWAMLSPGTSPTARDQIHNHMALDAVNARVVLFGGYAGSPSRETWLWDGTTWLQVALSGQRPGQRQMGALTYDTIRSEIVMWGSDGDELNEPNSSAYGSNWTWLWDGAVWTTKTQWPRLWGGQRAVYRSTHNDLLLYAGQAGVSPTIASNYTWVYTDYEWQLRYPALTPGFRYNHGMAFDSTLNVVVMAGGQTTADSRLSDTWTYNNVTWTQTNFTGFGPRKDMGMAYDISRGQVVMFGGNSGGAFSLTATNMTHETSDGGVTWVLKAPTTSPSARLYPAMAYDEVNNVCVIFGGRVAGTVSNETWTYDGTTWTNVTPGTSPDPRQQADLVWDPVRQRIVLIGGNAQNQSPVNDGKTWLWDGSSWTEEPQHFGPGYGPSQISSSVVSGSAAWCGTRIVHLSNSYMSISGKFDGYGSGFMMFDPIKNASVDDADPYVYFFSKNLGIAQDSDSGLSSMWSGSARANLRQGLPGQIALNVFPSNYDESNFGFDVPGGLSNDPALMPTTGVPLFPLYWMTQDRGLKGESSLCLLPANTFGFAPVAVSTAGFLSRDKIMLKAGDVQGYQAAKRSIVLPWNSLTVPTFSVDVNYGPYSGNDESFSQAVPAMTNLFATRLDAPGFILPGATQAQVILDDIQTQEPLEIVQAPPVSGAQYRMRAYDSTLTRIVFWTSDTIDTLGADYTGPGPITDVVVQNVIGQ
jgi:hypothetical protein